MKLKKRTAVVAVVALLVCFAVYLNWSYQKGLAGEGESVNAEQLEENTPVSDELRLLGQSLEAGEELPGEGQEVNNDPNESDSKVSEYFDKLRLTRQQARDEALGVLQTTRDDASISDNAKSVAVASISQIANNAVTEARIESLILSKGYADCAVFLNDGSLSIVVAPVDGGLKSEDAIRIKDIAVAESEIHAEEIRIIEARIG